MISVVAETFAQEVLQSPLPVVVEFSAIWCAPCQKLAPTVEGLAVEYAGQVKVVKVDIDRAPGLASEYGVLSVPTVAVFHNGIRVTQYVVRSKAHFQSCVEAAAAL